MAGKRGVVASRCRPRGPGSTVATVKHLSEEPTARRRQMTKLVNS